MAQLPMRGRIPRSQPTRGAGARPRRRLCGGDADPLVGVGGLVGGSQTPADAQRLRQSSLWRYASPAALERKRVTSGAKKLKDSNNKTRYTRTARRKTWEAIDNTRHELLTSVSLNRHILHGLRPYTETPFEIQRDTND